MEIDHDPLIQDRLLSLLLCQRKYVHELLVNRLIKLVQEKRVVRLTDRLDMTIAVDRDVKPSLYTCSVLIL